jgi:hypothetical protein
MENTRKQRTIFIWFLERVCILQDDDDVVDSTPEDDGPFPRGIQAGGNVLQWEGLLKGQYSHDELRDCSRDDLRVIHVFPGDDWYIFVILKLFFFFFMNLF